MIDIISMKGKKRQSLFLTEKMAKNTYSTKVRTLVIASEVSSHL